MQKTPVKPKTKSGSKALVHAYDCETIINKIPAGVKLISFDCFDTILWRNTAEPRDVFYNLCEDSAVKALGLTATLRTMSEQVAYQLNKIQKNQTQATLTEIYQQALPEANEATINTLIATELTYEKAACFAYKPMISLIQALHAKGFTLIITSDTYFTKTMLVDLLSACLPESTLTCFSEVYTSCDLGTAKFEHLFKRILERRVIEAREVCHIGDHPVSDYEKPSAIGIHAIQLIQHQPVMNEIMRMSALAASFTDEHIREKRGLILPFKALIATHLKDQDPATVIGYAVIGPLMLAFAHDIINQVRAKQLQGKTVKVAYLLRDAFLPARATEKLNGAPFGKDIRISRFSAFAASFKTVENIDTYLASRIDSGRFEEMAKQLGLPREDIVKLLKMTKLSHHPVSAFNQAVHQKATLEKIIANSKKYRERLFNYLQKELSLERGDTLVFVDLGYTGTAQLRLAPVFKEEYDITIEGCYLLSLQTPISPIMKHGLLSPTHYDDKALVMLVTYIALLEQICTSTEQSVADFDEAGQPIFSKATLHQDQIELIKPLHQASLQFIDDVIATPHLNKLMENSQHRRDTAAITLARLLYLPTKLENDYFSGFKHDVNMGTDDVIDLVNTDQSLQDLKSRGWLHSLKLQSKNARMNYPAEWRAISLELAMVLMAQHRFEFKVATTDLSHRQLSMPVIIRMGDNNNALTLDANLTYDGYYAIIIPTPDHSDIGIAFGQAAPLSHIHAIDALPLNVLYSNNEASRTKSVLNQVTLHDMQISKEGLLMANSENGLMLYSSQQAYASPMCLRVIFKPLEQSPQLEI